MNSLILTSAQATEAVRAYNAVFGEMDRALWCLSRHCRNSLLEGQSTPVVEALVWTVKNWWGVQGVRAETKTLMARALARLTWSAELFEPPISASEDAEEFACQCVTDLVSTTTRLGISRREFSLASKTLHWLLPWRIPVYDSFVRERLGIPSTWDHPEAYRTMTHKLFNVVRTLEDQDSVWMGAISPKSPLRALDKCLWWLGGGNAGQANVVRDPWGVVYRLGLDRN